MAASAANRTDTTAKQYAWINYPVKAASRIYGLCHVMIVAGYAVLAADTSGGRYVGLSLAEANNASGSNGDITVQVKPPSTETRFQVFACTGAAVATWLGKQVCFVDDVTVALPATTTNDVSAGVVVEVISATKVVVDTGAAVASLT